MNKLGLFVLVLLPVLSPAFSQRTSAAAAEPGSSAIPVITLGNSAVPLERGWKFEPGDSPWVNGAPEWAQPDFDDSHWAAMDLTPKAGAVDLFLGTSGFVPGWTKKGYPNLSGYAWYRLRVRVSDPARPIGLKMPDSVDDVFQLYANGRYVGEFGGFSGKNVTTYIEQPVSFTLPRPGPDGALTLALRFYMASATPITTPDAGGMHGPPALGLASAIGLMQASAEDTVLRADFGPLLVTFLLLLTVPLALWAWLYERSSHVWLWLFLALAAEFLYEIVGFCSNLTTALSGGTVQSLSAILVPFWYMSFVLFWWHWFGQEKRRWIARAAWLLTGAAILAGLVVSAPMFGWSLVPDATLALWNNVATACQTGLFVLDLVILVEGFRRDRLAALLPAIPILLALFGTLTVNYLLVAFHIPDEYFFFGLGISIGNVADLLIVVIIVGLALRRFMRTQVRESLVREGMHRDLEQAQQLQQRVLVPEVVTSAAFAVETEYHPAQTVGGDFFQTLTRPDGTLLVVIGDVSGKGVSASMLVAVLVGAIRSQAEHSFDPQAMLMMLNRRMLGRSGDHFATCLAAEIAPDGAMRVANAGHLAPYLNGREMELEGSLPLGFREDGAFPEETVKLEPGDRLIFMTDGVVEARKATELFGFEKARSVSTQGAEAIAHAAQLFGQEDDITVVRVAFAAAPLVSAEPVGA
ncbi:MAG: PP2C family protein-serine/threonine phosphatase [Acidobacteriaceae bacterium]